MKTKIISTLVLAALLLPFTVQTGSAGTAAAVRWDEVPALGIFVHKLTRERARELGYNNFFKYPEAGVVITAVEPDSPATRSTFRPSDPSNRVYLQVNDLITKVNNKIVKSAADVREVLRFCNSETINLTVRHQDTNSRQGETLVITRR